MYTFKGLHLMVLEDLGNPLQYLHRLVVPYVDNVPFHYLHVVKPIQQIKCTYHMMRISIKQHRPHQLGMEFRVFPTPQRVFYLPRVELGHIPCWHMVQGISKNFFVLWCRTSIRATSLSMSTRCFASFLIDQVYSYLCLREGTITKPYQLIIPFPRRGQLGLPIKVCLHRSYDFLRDFFIPFHPT